MFYFVKFRSKSSVWVYVVAVEVTVTILDHETGSFKALVQYVEKKPTLVELCSKWSNAKLS